MFFTFADGRISEAIVLPGAAGGPQAGEGGQSLGRDLGLRAVVLLHDVVIENVHTDSLQVSLNEEQKLHHLGKISERECAE